VALLPEPAFSVRHATKEPTVRHGAQSEVMVFASSRYRSGCTFATLSVLVLIGLYLAVSVYRDPEEIPLRGLLGAVRIFGRYGGIVIGLGMAVLFGLPAARFIGKGGFRRHELVLSREGLQWRGPESTGQARWEELTVARVEGALAPNTLLLRWLPTGETAEREAKLPAYQFGVPLRHVLDAIVRAWEDPASRSALGQEPE
jgi:hypothetical protein